MSYSEKYPLHHSVKMGKWGDFSQLLRKGGVWLTADTPSLQSHSLLPTIRILETMRLIESNATHSGTVSELDDQQNTSLHLAVQLGRKEMVFPLLAAEVLASRSLPFSAPLTGVSVEHPFAANEDRDHRNQLHHCHRGPLPSETSTTRRNARGDASALRSRFEFMIRKASALEVVIARGSENNNGTAGVQSSVNVTRATTRPAAGTSASAESSKRDSTNANDTSPLEKDSSRVAEEQTLHAFKCTRSMSLCRIIIEAAACMDTWTRMDPTADAALVRSFSVAPSVDGARGNGYGSTPIHNLADSFSLSFGNELYQNNSAFDDLARSRDVTRRRHVGLSLPCWTDLICRYGANVNAVSMGFEEHYSYVVVGAGGNDGLSHGHKQAIVDGVTPLHLLACTCGDNLSLDSGPTALTAAVDLLIDGGGADIDAQTVFGGYTALHLAIAAVGLPLSRTVARRRSHFFTLVAERKSAGSVYFDDTPSSVIPADVPECLPQTIPEEIVRLLLSHGADPNIPADNGLTPLDSISLAVKTTTAAYRDQRHLLSIMNTPLLRILDMLERSGAQHSPRFYINAESSINAVSFKSFRSFIIAAAKLSTSVLGSTFVSAATLFLTSPTDVRETRQSLREGMTICCRKQNKHCNCVACHSHRKIRFEAETEPIVHFSAE